MFLGKIYRVVPIVILMVIIFGFAYIKSSKFKNPPKAKDFAFRCLSWVFFIFSIIGLIAVLYAILDENILAAELFGSAFVIFFIPLCIIRLLAYGFYKNNPKFKHNSMKAKVAKKRRK